MRNSFGKIGKNDFCNVDLHSFSCDAGFYRIIPSDVRRPGNEMDIKRLFAHARKNKTGITFRAAGTSLSGQAVGGGIVADISRGWKRIEIGPAARAIRIGPGVICGFANKLLARRGRKLGFDPASIDACMIGGALANNSSGMKSGVDRNPFHTIKSLRFVLPSGTVVDGSRPESDDELRRDEPEIYDGLMRIRQEILNKQEIKNKISDSYKIKNTIGYSMNAFTEYRRPVDILAHLMIGSEGTLGFITEAEIATFPVFTDKLTAMLIFENIESACSALLDIRKAGAAAIEIMDDICIDSAKDRPGVPAEFGSIPPGSAAILCEFEFENANEIEKATIDFDELTRGFDLIFPPYIASEKFERQALWEMRKGLLPSLGKKRPPGSVFIIEDICVPVGSIYAAIAGLRELFEKYSYSNAGIYGHGMDGNLHFMIAADFSLGSEVERFGRFIRQLADLVTDELNGSLKAEHGTGRTMAPYVERQWGSDIYEIMKRIKKLIDPLNILNPGVLINSDERVHLRNLKDYPLVDSAVDDCIECGFCERVCPSRNLTFTPRRRITALREIERAGGDPVLRRQLSREYVYPGVDTCAADGLCESCCPMDINAGDAVKNLRSKAVSARENSIADFISDNFAISQKIAQAGVSAAKTLDGIIGEKNINRAIDFINKKSSMPKLPRWNENIGRPERMIRRGYADTIYFPCCVTRLMGRRGEISTVRAMTDVCSRLGKELMIPDEIDELCCGMAFDSKGFGAAARKMVNKTIHTLWQWTGGGELPVVFDSSSCAYFINNAEKYISDENREKFNRLRLLDSVEFIWSLLPYDGELEKIGGRTFLHPTCAVRKLGLEKKFKEVADYFAKDVYIPYNLECCGFAGDRGLLHPELNLCAAGPEAGEINRIKPDRCYSSNLPCEIGMRTASGHEFKSFIFLLHEAMQIK